MKLSIPRLAVLALFVAMASPAVAALDKHKDWDKSPDFQFLATDAEKKDWKKVSTDEDAEKFIALFWAKRDPDLKTPRNEFRERFDALVKAADERFAIGRKRGALTERGKALVLIGPPQEITAKATSSADAPFGGTTGAGGRDRLGRRSRDALRVHLRQDPPSAVGRRPVPGDQVHRRRRSRERVPARHGPRETAGEQGRADGPRDPGPQEPPRLQDARAGRGRTEGRRRGREGPGPRTRLAGRDRRPRQGAVRLCSPFSRSRIATAPRACTCSSMRRRPRSGPAKERASRSSRAPRTAARPRGSTRTRNSRRRAPISSRTAPCGSSRATMTSRPSSWTPPGRSSSRGAGP